MVEKADCADRIVAAHCHGEKRIMAALRAGCKTIEHGNYLDEEAIKLMIECDAMLKATCTIIEGGSNLRYLWSPKSYEKLQNVASQYKERLQNGSSSRRKDRSWDRSRVGWI